MDKLADGMMKLLCSRKAIYKFLISLYIAYWGVNYVFDIKEDKPQPRFCGEKGRELTKEEFIVAALESKYKFGQIRTDASTKTASEFYKKYPFCCSVDSPAKPKKRRSFFTGKRYLEYPGYVVAELYFPTSDKFVTDSITVCNGVHKEHQKDKSINYTSDGTCMILPRDKSLNYTNSRVPIGYCGGAGGATHEDLNIKDTPFGNDVLKTFNLQALNQNIN